MTDMNWLEMMRHDSPIHFKEGVKFCTFESSKKAALSPWTMMALFTPRALGEPEQEDESTWAGREVDLLDLFVLVGLCSSRSEAKQRMKEGSLSVAGKQVKTPTMFLDGISVHTLGKGKKNWALVQLW